MDKFVVVSKGQEVVKNEVDIEDRFEEVSEELTRKDIKSLRDYIEKGMNLSQKMQIIEIIMNEKERYTKNKNGYFINMNNISRDVLMKIKRLVDFMRDNMKEIKKVEDKMNEEKSKIDLGELEEEVTDTNLMEKNINFEIYSLDGIHSEIFEEFREDMSEESEFMGRDFLSEKREDAGYKVILKRYKRKYGGTKAKILKKFRDISKNSVNSKSAKNVLSKPVVKKTKVNKDLKKGEIEESVVVEETEEETEYDVEEY